MANILPLLLALLTAPGGPTPTPAAADRESDPAPVANQAPPRPPGAAAAADPDRAARARRRLASGQELAGRKQDCEAKHARLDLAMAADPALRARIRANGGPSWPEEEGDAALAELGREAGRCFEEVIAQAADFPDLAATARRELHGLRHLAVGCTAPEIEGRDVDGTAFRLGDYRGKVVVLYFWNQSCGPCVASFPRLRQHVEQSAGRPVALLGVNCGDGAAELRPIRDAGTITWRFWCDGDGAPGPIEAAWNVGMYPTSYVIDARGVIRYRNVNSGRNLSTAINLLVQELAAQPD